MVGFDPELHLRLLGERALAGGRVSERNGPNGRSELSDAAAALAALGVIDSDRASEISADYSLAAAMRSGPGRILSQRQRLELEPGTAVTEPLPARRVFSVGAVIPYAGGELRVYSVTVTDEVARIAASLFRGYPPGSRQPQRQFGPPALTVSAPGGQTVQARFSGSWGGQEAEGQFETDRAVPLDASWLELDGSRIELGRPAPAIAVELQQLEPERTPLRYLWQLMADFGDRHTPGSGVEAATATLIAAGLIDAGDPELAAIRWVNDGRDGQRGRMRHHPAAMHRSSPGAVAGSGPAPPQVPVEWRSLGLRAEAGPEGTIAVGAVTPVFDGVSAAVNVLRSSADRFLLDVETVGIAHPHPMADGVQRKPVAWWASDDRSNHYLGHMRLQ